MAQEIIATTSEMAQIITTSIPAIAALGGALIGAISTYCITQLNNKHNEKTRKMELEEAERVRKLEWERNEQRRKEERLFTNKIEAYKSILSWIDERNNCVAPLSTYLTSFTSISLFAPVEIRTHLREICLYLQVLRTRKDQTYTPEEEKKVTDMLDSLHGMLIDDLEKHNNFTN